MHTNVHVFIHIPTCLHSLLCRFAHKLITRIRTKTFTLIQPPTIIHVTFVVLEQETQRLLGDLQQITVEKKQQCEEFEATIMSLQQQGKVTRGILLMEHDHSLEGSSTRYI